MGQSTWVDNGSYWHSPLLSDQMRMQAEAFFTFRQFVDTKEAFGANKGEAVQFTKQLLIDTRGTTLVETDTMPRNLIKFVKDSVVVNEYGNGVEYTQKGTTLSIFDMKDKYQKGLVMDQKDALDVAVATEFQSGEFVAVCSAAGSTVFTTNGTATVTATVNPTTTNITSIVAYAKKKKIPKLGEHYVSILSVEAHMGLYNSLQAIAQYADPQYRYKDETGRYAGVRFVEDNNVMSNIIGNGSALGEGLLFGDESVMEAVALREELRYEETDVGRSKLLAWYFIGGFKKMWSLSGDDTNSVGTGIERIIRIFSA